MVGVSVLAVLGIALIGATLALKMAGRDRLGSTLVAYRLSFPRGLAADAVTELLGGLSGLLVPWWRRWLVSPFVIFETHAAASGIEHFVMVPAAWSRPVAKLLQSSVPGVRFEAAPLPALEVEIGAEYRLSTNNRSLRVDARALSAALLTSLGPLGAAERVVVQIVVTPAGAVAPVRLSNAKESDGLFSTPGTVTDSEAAAALRVKQSHPLLLAAARIGVASPSPAGAITLLRQAEVSWYGTRAPGVSLRRRLVPKITVARRMGRRLVPLVEWPARFNSEELAALIGWPIEAVAIPGVVLSGARLVAASPLIPRQGTVIADSNFPDDARPLAIDMQGRLRHLWLLGPTGTGKSTAALNLIVQDMVAGRSVFVFDPKGDLVADVLARVPADRRGDVILVDPAGPERVVGINPLRPAPGGSAEVAVENLVGLMKSLWRSSWGPRTDEVLRASFSALAGVEGATLCEVVPLLTDDGYRRRAIGHINDVGLESFWGWYSGLSDNERLAVIGPPMNKIRAMTMRQQVRAIIGQSEPKLDFAEAMRTSKIVLINLATGLVGLEAASLLGAIFVGQLWDAVLGRASLPQAERRPVMAYLDEWQHFVHLPTPMAAVLAEGRGLGLGVVLANQSASQLPEESKSAALANTRSKVLFQLTSGDARLLARELGGVMTADDLQGLGAYEVAAQLFAHGSTQPVATGRTRPPSPPCADADEIRAWSAEHYGARRADVEAAIRDRQAASPTEPIRRRRRPDDPEVTS